MNQKGNLTLIVLAGFAVLAVLFIGVIVMTANKSTFTPPTLNTTVSQAANSPTPQATQTPTPSNTTQVASPAANLSNNDTVNSIQQDLNTSNSNLNSIDQPAPSVLGIETTL